MTDISRKRSREDTDSDEKKAKNPKLDDMKETSRIALAEGLDLMRSDTKLYFITHELCAYLESLQQGASKWLMETKSVEEDSMVPVEMGFLAMLKSNIVGTSIFFKLEKAYLMNISAPQCVLCGKSVEAKYKLSEDEAVHFSHYLKRDVAPYISFSHPECNNTIMQQQLRQLTHEIAQLQQTIRGQLELIAKHKSSLDASEEQLSKSLARSSEAAEVLEHMEEEAKANAGMIEQQEKRLEQLTEQNREKDSTIVELNAKIALKQKLFDEMMAMSRSSGSGNAETESKYRDMIQNLKITLEQQALRIGQLEELLADKEDEKLVARLKQEYLNTVLTEHDVRSSGISPTDIENTKFPRPDHFGCFAFTDDIQPYITKLKKSIASRNVVIKILPDHGWPIVDGVCTKSSAQRKAFLVSVIEEYLIASEQGRRPNPNFHSEWKLKLERVPDDDIRESLRGQLRVVAIYPIKKNEFISLYVGLMLLASIGERDYQKTEQDADQFLSYLYHTHQKINDDVLAISARYDHGNITKFMNDYRSDFESASKPNPTDLQRINVKSSTLIVDEVAFVDFMATKDIAVGEELILAYDPDAAQTTKNSRSHALPKKQTKPRKQGKESKDEKEETASRWKAHTFATKNHNGELLTCFHNEGGECAYPMVFAAHLRKWLGVNKSPPVHPHIRMTKNDEDYTELHTLFRDYDPQHYTPRGNLLLYTLPNCIKVLRDHSDNFGAETLVVEMTGKIFI